MKIFSAAQMRLIDDATVEEQGIISQQLMERAAATCVEWLVSHYEINTPFLTLCGPGNNGGDGFSITRMLAEQGYSAKAFFLRFSQPSADCLQNINLLLEKMPDCIQILEPESFLTDIPAGAVIIDALLGIGVNRKADGWVARFIQHVNTLPNQIVSIDIPSGLAADASPQADDAIIQASRTLTFQAYKRAMLHLEGGKYAGEVHVLDIGLSADAMNSQHSNYTILNQDFAQKLYKPRLPFSHKGTHGTAFLVGGSKGMIGAITLSARAAGRAGAGKVIALLPECGYLIMQTAVPEAMCQTSGQDELEAIDVTAADAIGIGPGIAVTEGTTKALQKFLKENTQPLVLDAGALNIIGNKKDLLHALPPHTILTPHPKEFDRMFGDSTDSMRRADVARAMAMRYNIIIVLKDRYTFIAAPDGACYYNTSGNAGLATGGSGDVLLGMITGLSAAKYAPLHAALLGVWLHGAAAEDLLKQQSVESVVAGDIAEEIGSAFKRLQVNP